MQVRRDPVLSANVSRPMISCMRLCWYSIPVLGRGTIALMASLLAVDIGLRAGLAIYTDDGRLRSYRSHNFGSISRMRRGVPSIYAAVPDLCCVLIEGGGRLGSIWIKEAERRDIQIIQISAEIWRSRLMLARQQRNGKRAKSNAQPLARAVIEWSDAERPTSLRHDAAEAILVGFWGVIELGWLAEVPKFVQNQRK